jgi:hypothetical protein
MSQESGLSRSGALHALSGSSASRLSPSLLINLPLYKKVAEILKRKEEEKKKLKLLLLILLISIDLNGLVMTENSTTTADWVLSDFLVSRIPSEVEAE